MHLDPDLARHLAKDTGLSPEDIAGGPVPDGDADAVPVAARVTSAATAAAPPD